MRDQRYVTFATWLAVAWILFIGYLTISTLEVKYTVDLPTVFRHAYSSRIEALGVIPG